MGDIKVVDALPDLSDKAVLGFDVETTRHDGKDSCPYRDKIVSLQISDGIDVWILRGNYISAIPFLTNPSIKKIAHSAAFDVKFLRHHLGGIEIGNLHDSLLTERLITAGTEVSNGLEAVLARRCGVFTDKTIRDQFTTHTGPFSESQIQYMATDVLHLPEIRRQQLEEVSRAGLGKVLALENSIVPVIAGMELDGVGFDRDLWSQYLVWFEEKKQEIKHRLSNYLDLAYMPSIFGGIDIELNLNSTNQVAQQLTKMGCDLPDTRESTLQSALEDYDSNSAVGRFIADLLEYRGWEKLIGYAYHKHVNPITGNIHCSWNQLGAQTGRFSSSDPNLQNVRRPIEGEPNLRAAFIPDEGEVFIIADYSQQEPRILAQLVGDPKMLEAASNTDMYSSVGEMVYGHKIEKKSTERQQLKVAYLAHYYGAYAKKLAYVLKISLEEAIAFQQRLDSTFTKAAQAGQKRVQFVAQRGYMTSLLGRRCWLPGAVGASKDDMWRFRNQALNGPVQMSASDMSKEAVRCLDQWKRENKYDRVKLRLLEHDELVVSCPESQAEEVLYNVVGAMESASLLICPQVKPEVEAGIKSHWTKV